MKHILRFDKEEMIKLINQIPDEMKLHSNETEDVHIQDMFEEYCKNFPLYSLEREEGAEEIHKQAVLDHQYENLEKEEKNG